MVGCSRLFPQSYGNFIGFEMVFTHPHVLLEVFETTHTMMAGHSFKKRIWGESSGPAGGLTNWFETWETNQYKKTYPNAAWCWNIYQHLPEQNHPVL